MLESSLFESQGRKKTRKPVTVVVSAIAHLVTVAVLALIPLLHTQALTMPAPDMSLFLPRIERPRDLTVFSARPSSHRQARPAEPNTLTAPTTIPQRILINVEPPLGPEVPFLPPTGGNGNVPIPAILGNTGPEISTPVAPPTLPLLPPPPAIDVRPVRQSAGVQAANLIYQVKPVYPPLARTTRTQGIVVLEAVISKNGSIDSLRVISGHPLLTQAALDAVQQWRYRPTMLNNEPVDVVTTVTVTFTLQ
jgi:protein TonB